VAKLVLEPQLDPSVDPDWCGCRPGKSAKGAGAVTRQRRWQYDWVVEFDIKGAFDNREQGLRMKAVRKQTDSRWVVLYVAGWGLALTITEAGAVKARQRGTPPGGVLGPLLLKLFLHYALARWLRRALPRCPFARYAEEGGGHCRPERPAPEVKQRLADRLREGGVELPSAKPRLG
jgi:retron-type reverse transcriptase